MARANWYCKTCNTHGGGPPEYMTIKEHIKLIHSDGLAQIEHV